VLLSDVATVKDTIRKVTQEIRRNGKLGAQIAIQKQSGANSVAIADAVLAELPMLAKDLPPDVHIDVMINTSDFIKKSIGSLIETVMLAFIIVMLVVLFFLGRWRATFIIVLAIPVSLVSSFIYLFVTGGSINIISLSSLSIAIGMVVDDAIVVLENITKHVERGSSPREAAIYGTNEVWLAVLASTLTVIAVFFPLTMVGGMAGILFKQLGWIVCITIAVSLVVAFTLVPMLSAKMLKFQAEKTYKGLGIIFKPIEKLLDGLDNGYAKILTWSVRHRTFLIITCFGIFLASIALVSKVPVEFLPSSDDGQITATIEMEQGRSLEYTNKITARITEYIQANFPEVESMSTTTGAADGSSIFAAFGTSGSHVISINMRCSDAKARNRDIFMMADLMRDEFNNIPEIVKFVVSTGGTGGSALGGGGDIEVKIFGYNFDVSEAFAKDLMAKIQEVKGTRDLKLSREEMKLEYRVIFDREKLALYGLNTATASTFVRNRINGLIASKYREDGDEYDIVVRYAEEFRQSTEDIENIKLYSASGQSVRVKDVGRVVEYFSPPTIQHENRQRIISISMSLYGAVLGDVVQDINKILDETEFPEGVSVSIGGNAEEQQNSFDDMFTLLLLIIILVYIVMATQFESLRMPFIIILSLPFAFTGVFLILFLTNTPLSLIALIGAVMLVGIVVKNGIVMVDFTNLLRDRGMTINQAVITAGKSRLRPVLMTSLTTILGMLPLAIGIGEGSEIWQPMGIAIIGGMTFSTALTLVIVPVVYSIFGSNSLKRQRRTIIHDED